MSDGETVKRESGSSTGPASSGGDMQRRKLGWLVAGLWLAAVALGARGLSGCGGGTPVDKDGVTRGSISGVVVKGALKGGTVTAYQLDAQLARRKVLGTATTDASGGFTIEVPSYNGPLLVVATSGSYVEEAIGESVNLVGIDLTAVVPDYTPGAEVEGVVVTPLSSIATAFTTFHVLQRGEELSKAHADAWRALGEHFGVDGASSVVPADFLKGGVQATSREARVGLVLAGLSQAALQMALESGFTKGNTVNAATLTAVLVEDALADGVLDGAGNDRRLLFQGSAAIKRSTLRSDLVQAMMDFLASPLNASGAKAHDMGLFLGHVAASTNPYLFCTPGLQHANCASTEGPKVEFSVTFEANGNAARPPVQVGASRFVAGTLRITVDAQANPGTTMVRLTVEVNGHPPAAGSSSHSRFTGTWNTKELSADGPLTITAVAVDSQGNPTFASYHVVVDNTRPAIPTAVPTGGVFSRSFQVDGAAEDSGSGLATFEVDGLGSHTDDYPELLHRIRFAYAIPDRTDGEPLLFAFKACDAVGNCEHLARTVTTDQTPPTVQFAVAPPLYTQETDLTVRLSAVDVSPEGVSGVGVSKVFVSVNGDEPIAARPEGDEWLASFNVMANSRNFLVVWGVDTIGNTGMSAPTRVSVLNDMRPESLVQVATSYFSEEHATFKANADGTPVMPLQLEGIATTSTSLSGTGLTVHKLVTRLSDTGNLQASNPNNTPYLLFTINQPHKANPATDTKAPTQTAQAVVTISCAGCTTQTRTFPAIYIGDEKSLPSEYLVPLSRDTIPDLGTTAKAALNLSVRLDVTDAAGNLSQAGPVTVAYNLVGLKLAVLREDDYVTTTTPDQLGIYYYRVNKGEGEKYKYKELFTGTTILPLNQDVRAVRYVVHNPWPVPVRVALDPGANSQNWRFGEAWEEDARTPNTNNGTFKVDGVDFQLNYNWKTDADSECAIELASCGEHRSGASGQKWTCDNHMGGGVVASGTSWKTKAYRPVSGRYESSSESVAKNGSLNGRDAYVMPAASGSTAERLVIYVVVPHDNRTADPLYDLTQKQPTYPGASPSGITTTVPDRPQFWWGDKWEVSLQYNCRDDLGFPAGLYYRYTAKRVIRYLNHTNFTINTPLTLATQALDPNTSSNMGPLRNAGAPAASVNFNL
jgi:hypothetical protein